MKIKIKKLSNFDNSLSLPSYETKGAAGADLRAMTENKETILIKPGERKLIPTGLSMEIEEGYQVAIRPRSGLSLKSDLLICNSPGTIDSDYRGEVCIIMGNFGNKEISISHGDRIAQMVVEKVIQASFVCVDKLKDTKRGSGGFGSTGKN